MKGNMKKVITLVMALVLVLSITAVFAAASTKTVEKINGTWTYTVNGKADYSFTGFATNTYGTWYVEKGIVTFNTTSVIKGADGNWWNVVGSKVTAGETVAKNANGWWYIDPDGKVDFTYDGLATNKYGTWYCEDGKVDFTKNGAFNSSNTWYAIIGNKVSATYTGFAADLSAKSAKTATVVYFVNGAKSTATSVIKNTTDGKWYGVVNGFVVKGQTANAAGAGQLYYILSNVNGSWIIGPDGYVTFDYTGLGLGYEDREVYYVENSRVELGVNGVLKVTLPTKTAWAYIVDGELYEGSATVAKNQNGWWYINKNGFVDFSFNGLATNEYGTWYCENGKVNFDVTGAYYNNGTWVALKDSKVDTYANGPVAALDGSGDVYFVNGVAVSGNQLVYVNGEWVLADSTASVPCLGTNVNGTWYVGTDGTVDFTFTGFFRDTDNTIKYIENGQFKANKTDIMDIDLSTILENDEMADLKAEFGVTGENAATACFVVKAYVQNSVVYAAEADEIVLDAAGNRWLIENAVIDGDVNYNTVALDDADDFAAIKAEKAAVYFTGTWVDTATSVKYNVTDGKISDSLFTGFVWDNGTIKYYKNGAFNAKTTDVMDIDLFAIDGIPSTILETIIEEAELDEDTTSLVVKAYVAAGVVYHEEDESIVEDANGDQWIIEEVRDADDNGFNIVKLDYDATEEAKAPVYYTGSTYVFDEDGDATSKYVVNGKIDATYTGFYYDNGRIYYMTNGKFDDSVTGVMDVELLKIIPSDILNEYLENIDYYIALYGYMGYIIDDDVIDQIKANLVVKAFVLNGVVYYNEIETSDAFFIVKDGDDAWLVACGYVPEDTIASTSYAEILPNGIYGNIINIDAEASLEALEFVYFTGIEDAHGIVVDLSKVISAKNIDAVVDYPTDSYYFEDGKFDDTLSGLVTFTVYGDYDDEKGEYEIEERTALIKNGALVKATGIYTDADGVMWYVENGYVVKADAAYEVYTKAIDAKDTDPSNYYMITKDGKVDVDFTGFDADNAYYVKGVWAGEDYQGLVTEVPTNDETENVLYYYVNAGRFDATATGLFYDGDAAWYVAAGYVINNTTAFTTNEFITLADAEDEAARVKAFPANFYYVVNGKVDVSYTGFDADNAYYIEGAFSGSDYYALVAEKPQVKDIKEAKYYYVAEGRFADTVTGAVQDPTTKTIVYVANGIFDDSVNGTFKYSAKGVADVGYCVIAAGEISKVTGVYYLENDNAYIVNGIQTEATKGVLATIFGTAGTKAYIASGDNYCDITYDGNVTIDDVEYVIENGKVVVS